MIYDANAVDIMGERRDGGIDMFIISSGPMDAEPETQKLLLDKVENYLSYVMSGEFAQKFPGKQKKTRIILKLAEPGPDLLMQLCEKIKTWTAEHGVRFEVTTELVKGR